MTRYSYDAATAVGDYALFGAASGAIVDVYNSSLVKLTPANLSDEKKQFCGNYGRQLCVVWGRQKFEDLSVAWSPSAATTVSNYALFGGGYVAITTATVDCYEYVEKNLELTLLKGAKYKFQNMSNEITVTEDFSTISIPSPATGYVKFKNTTIS